MVLKNLNKKDNLLIVLDSIYCLHRIGDHSAADELLSESKCEWEKDVSLKPLFQLVHIIGKYQQTKFLVTDYAELSNVLTDPIHSTGLKLYQGWVHLLLGYYLKHEEEFHKAEEYFLSGHHLNELLEVYYWMNRFKFLPSEEKINSFLRLYPLKSIYSLIMGNTYFKEEVKPNTLLEKNQAQNWLHEEDEDSFDCWVISNKNIIPAKYKSLNVKEENCLDLFSGLINDRGEFTFLLISELNCLSFLIASELIGTSSLDMAEFLERTEEEAEDLIKYVTKLGIPIKKVNNLYFLDWSDKPKIIIPRNLKVIGLQEYVRKKMPTFSKPQLVDLLQLTQFGAEALMKKWALAGFIRPMDKSENSMWKFL